MSRHDLDLAPEQQADKRAARRLVEDAGGAEAASLEARTSPTQLRSYGNPHTPDFMPIDVARDLEAVSHGRPGHPAVTRHLARRAGFALVPLPDAPEPAGDWHDHLAELAGRPAAITKEICAALSDSASPGRVTGAEIRARGLRNRVSEAQEALAALDARLERAEAEQ